MKCLFSSLALLFLSACAAAQIDDDLADRGAQPGDLHVITAAGVSGLPAGLAYSEDAIEAALPGYDATAITMATETETRSAIALFRDGLQVIQILPASGGGIGAVHGVSAGVRGPGGQRIGISFADARIPRSACREGKGNWFGMAVCTAPEAPNVTLIFAIPGYVDPSGLPDDRTLGSAALQRIIWRAPGGSTS